MCSAHERLNIIKLISTLLPLFSKIFKNYCWWFRDIATLTHAGWTICDYTTIPQRGLYEGPYLVKPTLPTLHFPTLPYSTLFNPMLPYFTPLYPTVHHPTQPCPALPYLPFPTSPYPTYPTLPSYPTLPYLAWSSLLYRSENQTWASWTMGVVRRYPEKQVQSVTVTPTSALQVCKVQYHFTTLRPCVHTLYFLWHKVFVTWEFMRYWLCYIRA